jgi:acetoin utilization protein AcuB
MMNEKISTIMTRNLLTVNVDDTLQDVKNLIEHKRIHHIPVVDGNKLVGIITTGDLLWLNRPFSDYPNIHVRDVMTRKIAFLEPDDKVGAVAEVFLEHLFHCIPICDEGNLVGIVTTHDLMKYEYKREYPNELVG